MKFYKVKKLFYIFGFIILFFNFLKADEGKSFNDSIEEIKNYIASKSKDNKIPENEIKDYLNKAWDEWNINDDSKIIKILKVYNLLLKNFEKLNINKKIQERIFRNPNFRARYVLGWQEPSLEKFEKNSIKQDINIRKAAVRIFINGSNILAKYPEELFVGRFSSRDETQKKFVEDALNVARSILGRVKKYKEGDPSDEVRKLALDMLAALIKNINNVYENKKKDLIDIARHSSRKIFGWMFSSRKFNFKKERVSNNLGLRRSAIQIFLESAKNLDKIPRKSRKKFINDALNVTGSIFGIVKDYEGDPSDEIRKLALDVLNTLGSNYGELKGLKKKFNKVLNSVSEKALEYINENMNPSLITSSILTYFSSTVIIKLKDNIKDNIRESQRKPQELKSKLAEMYKLILLSTKNYELIKKNFRVGDRGMFKSNLFKLLVPTVKPEIKNKEQIKQDQEISKKKIYYFIDKIYEQFFASKEQEIFKTIFKNLSKILDVEFNKDSYKGSIQYKKFPDRGNPLTQKNMNSLEKFYFALKLFHEDKLNVKNLKSIIRKIYSQWKREKLLSPEVLN